MYYYADMKRLGLTLLVTFMIALTSFLFFILFKKDFGSKENNTENEIYATDITISTEFRSLTLYVENNLKFTKTPYLIVPLNYNQGVETKILDYLGKEKEGAIFKDNFFTATKTGTYYLRFIAKTKNSTKYDVIKITVIDKVDENCKSIILKEEAKTISSNENLDISQFIMVYNLGISHLKYKSLEGRMYGSIFIPEGPGNYIIEIIIENVDYLIYTNFIVVVNSEKEISISLYDVANKKIEYGEDFVCSLDSKMLLYSYIVEGLTSQLIMIEVYDNEIVSLVSSDAPIIIFELKNIGETEIVIKIPNNNYKFKFNLKVE